MFIFENAIKMVRQSIIIMKCAHFCPYNWHLKPCYGNRWYGGIATWGHFTYHKLYTIDSGCYSFLFNSNKPPHKEIWPLSTFRGACFLKISVTDTYILKRDILVIALFVMFLSNSE